MKIALLGAGNVATHLGKMLVKGGNDIVYVYSRSKNSGDALGRALGTTFGTTVDFKFTEKPELIIIAVSDHAIKDLLKTIPDKKVPIVHTSGSVPLNIFGKTFPNHGVLYPLQTFSKSRQLNNKNYPVFIEGNNPKMLTLLKKAAGSISKDIHEMNSSDRKLVHLTAVLTCNFTNQLYVQAEKLLTQRDIPFNILEPLIKETAAKASKQSPSEVQTGPAARGDKEIIDEHVRMLQKHPQLQQLYKLMSAMIQANSNK